MVNKIAVLAICIAIVLNAAVIGSAKHYTQSCTGVTGTAKAASFDGKNYNRDTQVFNIGQKVYITGFNFADSSVPLTGIVYWTVTDQSAEGPEKSIISSGDADLTTVKPSGYESFPNEQSYIVPEEILTITSDLAGKDLRLNTWHEDWPTECTHKNDFKTVKDTFSAIPEFPTVALPIAAIIGLLFFFQHRKNKEE